MIIDDIVQYANEDSVRGEYSRELLGIISDYKENRISGEDKDQLVEAIRQGLGASELAKDEVNLRWAVAAAEMVTSLV